MSDRKSSQPLIDAVERLSKEGFSRIGFRRREPGIFTVELAGEFLGSVGLNRAVGRGEGWLDVHPSVGVRYQPLERKLAELQGVKWDSYAPATIFSQLGYLMPQHRFLSWSFSIGTDPAPTVEDMIRAVETYGVPFMRSSASLDAIIGRLSTFAYTTADSRSYRLPLTYFMSGDRVRAIALVETELKKLGNQKDAGADFYRKFAENLRKITQGE
jgi:hypothetical protein